jgi:hypothetical protein
VNRILDLAAWQVVALDAELSRRALARGVLEPRSVSSRSSRGRRLRELTLCGTSSENPLKTWCLLLFSICYNTCTVG